MASLLDQFLAEEADGHVARVLREAAETARGERYFTFDRFNVRLDLDAGLATIELDQDSEITIPLPLQDLLSQLPLRSTATAS